MPLTTSILQGTTWPPESAEAARNLIQTVECLPDLPEDASLAPFKVILMEFVLCVPSSANCSSDNTPILAPASILEGAHARVKELSEKYGRTEIGFLGVIKYKFASRRRHRCTDTLRTCRDDIEIASASLRTYLNNISPTGDTTAGPVPSSEPPSEFRSHLIIPLVNFDHPHEPLESSRTTQTMPAGQTVASERATGYPMPLQNPSPDSTKDGEKRSSSRAGALIAARKTFEAVETCSEAIPVVGGFVGVAAKVGLAFVNMVETMGDNEEVSEQLASHTEELSSHLEHFRKNGGAQKGDEVTVRIEGLRKELEGVQVKVNKWNSSGLFKKLLLSSDHSDELKANQDTLLVSLKSNDIVVELKDVTLRAERARLLDRLGDGSYGAQGSSIEDVICLPGTRVELLKCIDEWIKDTSPSVQRVLWIRGMAGRGKSAIAATVAHNWASKGSCAIFHFRRGQNALDGQFICALARQLGKGLVPEVKQAILDCVKEKEDIAKERLDQQFKTLFIGALGKIQNHTHPIVIVVDALDEWSNINDAVTFVRLIDQQSSFLPTNLKFLLTCRPEPPLVLALELRKWRAEDLDAVPQVTEDIKRFIYHACGPIRHEHQLPAAWPSQTDLEGIVQMSQGLFQWARTAVAYISGGSPEDRLRVLLRRSSEWAGLDDLYHQILSRAFEKADEVPQRKQMLSSVLGTIVVAPYPITVEVIAFLHADHEMFRGQENVVRFLCKDVLEDLNSLLHIPQSASEPLRLMHTSIRDLLTNQARCKNQSYFLNPLQDHQRLAALSLEIMQHDLKQNICELLRIPRANSEIQHAVDRHVPSGLRYCCHSWSHHLAAGSSESDVAGDAAGLVTEKFTLFSDEKLMSWLEVMSLIGAMTQAYHIARGVNQWLLKWPQDKSNDSLRSLWNDTQRFIAAFFEPISFNAFDIYALALPRSPVETNPWLKYRGQATAWILIGKRERNWSANLWTASADSGVNAVAFSPDGSSVASRGNGRTVQLWDAQTGALSGDPLTGHSNWIRSIAFSPDGKVLASGSDDNTIRLWDAQTGAPLGDPLTGHRSSIRSVVFSPDSKVLASGSDDRTVRLRDVATGAPLGDPLFGHRGSIRSVVFSPDGQVLASGSTDTTIRLWDTHTRAPLGVPLTGHGDWITSVVFLPDGKVLVSGSRDKTVRLWNAQTGVPLGDPLTGHRCSIRSVAFTPDGKVLASGSDDKTIRLWNAQTGAPLGDPLTGHSDWIRSVAFSPDGKVLVSGSDDKTVRLWDTQTRAPLSDPLTGHSTWITSVAFSPDGKILASGSDDKTVVLWDAQARAPLSDPLTGHPGSIRSVVFSPDGNILASGSDGDNIQLWDAKTGAPWGDPLTGHSSGITTLVFSPDGKILASGSLDKTIRLWDVQTGAPLGDPLTGHRGGITSVVFSPGGKVLASGSSDSRVRLWDPQTRAPLRDPLTGHIYSITTVVFSPDGKVLASGSSDKTIQLWDAQTGALLSDPLTGHRGSIRFIVFSPDGKVLASGSTDTTIRLWNAQTGALLGDPLTGHSDWITSVVFSPDGKVLASGSQDRTVRLWDAQTGAALGDHLTGHSDSITSVVYLSDGKVLASASRDGMLRFWNPLTHQIIHLAPSGLAT